MHLHIFDPTADLKMLTNTITDLTGQILTGKIWRRRHTFFNNLLFYSNILCMADMAESLQGALSRPSLEKHCMEVLLVSQTQLANSNLRTGLWTISKGLDEVHPFDDTDAVAIILEEAEIMLGPHLHQEKGVWSWRNPGCSR